MINRRKFLEAGAIAGVGSMLPWKTAGAAGVESAAAAAAVVPVGVSPVLTKYRDLLPVPTRVGGFAYDKVGTTPEGWDYYEITASTCVCPPKA